MLTEISMVLTKARAVGMKIGDETPSQSGNLVARVTFSLFYFPFAKVIPLHFIPDSLR